MKKITLIMLSLFLLNCAGLLFGTKYKYYYSLNKPVSANPSDMNFSDSLIVIGFFISDKAINFELKNISNEPIKIIWDEATIVQFGEAKKVMHSGIKYIDKNNPQTATVVPSGATITDLVIPTENIYYLSGQYGGWEERDLFPTTDLGKEQFRTMIFNCKDQKFTLHLPIVRKDTQLTYSFEFVITDVQELKK